MAEIDPWELARGYAAWAESGDRSVMELFSPEFLDNVSGRRGLGIFDLVAKWAEESFADKRIELHAAMRDGDRIMVWFTSYAVHIGNGFPRLVGKPVNRAEVRWPQVHIFRVDNGLVVEHWAVRDDAAMLDCIGE